MQKSTRSVPRKPAPPPPPPPRTPRAVSVKQPKPKITRLERDVELVAPRGCHASVLLKLVDRDDGHRYYSWWAVVGRHDMDSVSVSYKYTGEETIRFDLPDGIPLSAESVQPHLTRFLARRHEGPGDPPIIID